MRTIPDRLPAWIRNSDYVVLRVIAIACFIKMLGP
jgi:hypothetical protein